MNRSDYLPVVSAEEMARVEASGAGESFMLEAGRQVANAAAEMLAEKHLSHCTLLVGSGNNGGDAWVAGLELLRRGIATVALALPAHSPLNHRFRAAFIEAGGQVRPLEGSFHPEEHTLLLDGLVGTGFRGPAEGPLLAAILSANESRRPILAIDIPSGLNGTTGAVETAAIVAERTLALGLPKSGFFLGQGWNHIGRLTVAPFGLSPAAISKARPVAWMPLLERMTLPPMLRDQHKYSRGFVVGFGGSKELKGAMKLAGSSALHAGAGIVKLFSLEELGEMPDELIALPFQEAVWQGASAKAQALFIGPGLGRSAAARAWLAEHLPPIAQPCVLDADALHFLPQMPRWPARAILTPHRGEMEKLLGEAPTLERAQAYVDARRTLIVLKGAPTFILSPDTLPIVIPRGDPGMATAGSGDVLTGLLAALLAQGAPLLEGSVLAATLHALAGEAAARAKTSYGYTASDLIAYFPAAFSLILRE